MKGILNNKSTFLLCGLLIVILGCRLRNESMHYWELREYKYYKYYGVIKLEKNVQYNWSSSIDNTSISVISPSHTIIIKKDVNYRATFIFSGSARNKKEIYKLVRESLKNKIVTEE
jgi:hypothetical protein